MPLEHNHLLAIPVFNEQAHVTGVLDQARQFSSNILVIDDGSTDATPTLLADYPNIQIMTHAENRGYGKSIADAFRFAIRGRFRWLVTMDCDEQHEASRIPAFLAAAADDDADIISGTRYPGGFDGDEFAPADRREINRRITAKLNERLGLNITDAFCGFKAYRVESLSALTISVPGYAMPMQLWVQASRAGLRIRELPIRLIYNDPNRHFGGLLDDPDVRLQHYQSVLESELLREHSWSRCTGASTAPRCRPTDPCSTLSD